METNPGKFLKGIREKLGLGLKEVEEASRRIAEAEGNEDFYISAARLHQIENDDSAPSVFKMFSLSAIYAIGFLEILRRYGIDPDRAKQYHGVLELDSTRPVSVEVYDKEATVTLPVRLDPSFRWQTTHLVSRVVEIWGEIPVSFLLQVNPRQHLYGYVGLQDLTMFPLIRPGALVMIDQSRRRVQSQGWRSEFDRPIYFVELRDGYRCAWCQLDHSRLTLIPHPMSSMPAESFNCPDEAEVVGQVVGVAMRIVPPAQRDRANMPKLSTPPSSEK